LFTHSAAAVQWMTWGAEYGEGSGVARPVYMLPVGATRAVV
jgi:hypothetical protein